MEMDNSDNKNNPLFTYTKAKEINKKDKLSKK